MNRRGMTLVEVIVVLAILGIAAAAVVPAVQRIQEDPVELSVQQVLSLLRGARRMAVEQGVPVTVIVDPHTRRYWVDGGAADSLRSGVLALEPGVTLIGSGPRARFAFEPGGLGHGSVLALTGRGANLPVRVDRWSGEVVVGAQ